MLKAFLLAAGITVFVGLVGTALQVFLPSNKLRAISRPWGIAISKLLRLKLGKERGEQMEKQAERIIDDIVKGLREGMDLDDHI